MPTSSNDIHFARHFTKLSLSRYFSCVNFNSFAQLHSDKCEKGSNPSKEVECGTIFFRVFEFYSEDLLFSKLGLFNYHVKKM